MKTITHRLLPLAASCLVAPAIAQASEAGFGQHIKALDDLVAAFSESGPMKGEQFPLTAPERRIDRTTDLSAPLTKVRLSEALAPNERKEGGREIRRTAKNVERGGGRRGELEEIVVTAQRREERLQDVPISISVLGGEHLDSSTARDVTEELSRVPGVSISHGGTLGAYMVPIRGVANFSSGLGRGTTAYYLDSIPFGFNRNPGGPDPDTYDLDRVEVLRGPQGTLYGASALNGVVRILTKDANLEKFEFKARGLTSNTKHGDWNYRGDVSANVPIVEGKLAARAVLGYQDLSGWLDKPNRKDANGSERLNGRLKINARPTENLLIDASAWFSRADYGSQSIGFDSERDLNPGDESRSTDYGVFGFKVGYDFHSFSLTSTTGYLQFDNVVVVEGSPNNPNVTFYVDSDNRSEVLAQEVALTSRQGRDWRWTAGGMYRDATDRAIGKIPFLFGTNADRKRSVSESYAVFGELTRVFLDQKLELTGGMRYFRDRVTDTQISTLTGLPAPIRPENTFSKLSPRIVVTYIPSDDLSLYASYGEGFRSGLNQDVLFGQAFPAIPPVKEDSLTNYEVGAKGTLWDRRLSFDAALYYIDWQDVQQQLSVNLGLQANGQPLYQSIYLNGESASGIGFDFALTGAIADRLEWGVNASWNDLKLDAEIISQTAAAAVVMFGKGDRLNNSVKYTAGASAGYIFPIGGGGFEGRFSTSANYTSKQSDRLFQAGRVLLESGDPMFIGTVSLSVRAPSNWTATLFVDNVWDESGSPQAFPTLDAVNNRLIRERPRTIGLQFECRY